jgi:signal transduction histidine kinase
VGLSPQVHFALSRIIKEALNNAIRHARCRHVAVAYALSPQAATIEITDDGAGFDLARALRRQDKFGLKNMQEYARELGCSLELQSAPGQGTRIAVRFPLYETLEGSLTCAPLTTPQ